VQELKGQAQGEQLNGSCCLLRTLVGQPAFAYAAERALASGWSLKFGLKVRTSLPALKVLIKS